MKNRVAEYLRRQKKFWEVTDETVAKFKFIATDKRSEEDWAAAAVQDEAFLFEDISLPENGTVLEVGCGVGRLLEQVARRRRFRRLIGVDLSESMLGFARRRVGADPRIELLATNGQDLSPIGDELVDFAYSMDVFIHLYDAGLIRQCLREALRVLKPGGLFRFNVFRFDPEKAFADSVGGRFAKWMYRLGLWNAGSHRWNPRQAGGFNGNLFQEPEMRRLLQQTGFSVLSIRPVEPYLWYTARKPPVSIR